MGEKLLYGWSAKRLISAVFVALMLVAYWSTPGFSAPTNAPQPSCPCSIWNGSITPTSFYQDTNPVEVGVKFRSDVNGYVYGVSFYKYNLMTGAHLGHLWASDGTKLAEAVFTNETASGWQTVNFASPVYIQANTTYIASFLSNDWIATGLNFFATSGVNNTPLHALADGVDGPNGVYLEQGGFPAQTNQATNYYVDLVFNTTAPVDNSTPAVTTVIPPNGLTQVSPKTAVVAHFSKPLLATSVNATTMKVVDPSSNAIAGAVTYNAVTYAPTFTPTNPLNPGTRYTVTLKSGIGGILDLNGNPMGADFTWTFTTAPATPSFTTQGPGGPILVVTTSANHFTEYYSEILKNEGFNEFALADISTVTSTMLAGYDVVILGDMPLTAAQVTLFTNWVQGGGNLIAMHPDKQLASLLGLTTTTNTLAEAYLLVNTASGPGVGIVNQTIQYHGTADIYGLGSATKIADLYTSLTAQANAPAVTINTVGANGGEAAAFTYDLARSVVYSHQGNPSLAYQHTQPWQSQYIATDLFYPSWTNYSRIGIPQADEQQRLLGNMILQMNANRKPLPRFWYFPRDNKAVVILTGDDHNSLQGNNYTGTSSVFFTTAQAASTPGCSVDNWECIRASSYLFAGNPMSNETAAAYTAQGFELGIHSDSAWGSTAWCANWTATSLPSIHNDLLNAFAAKYWSIATQSSIRSHCYAWYGYIDEQKTQYSNGIRLDTDVAYWPSGYVQVPSGFMNGSGTPMRYADVDGTTWDVYAAPTFVSDDNGTTAQPVPASLNTLLDNALGPTGYYGAFTINMHSDDFYSWSYPGESAVIASAQAHGVPVVSGRQMLTWLDGRNNSSFRNFTWNNSVLGFDVTAATGSNGLEVMLPASTNNQSVSQVTKNSVPVPFHLSTIKGVNYVIFNADNAHFNVTYTTYTAPPVLSSVQNTVVSSTTDTIVANVNEVTTARIDYGTSANSLSLNMVDNNLTATHTFQLTNLVKGTQYYYRVTVQDTAGNTTVSPTTGNPPASFMTMILDSQVADFQAGTLTSAYLSSMGDGEVMPNPTEKSEFSGTKLDTTWYSSSEGGTLTFSNGYVLLNGYLIGTSATYSSGHSLEFSAIFQPAPEEHIGFGTTLAQGPWAIFSTGTDGANMHVRTNTGTGFTDNYDTILSPSLFGTEHRYRIDWNASNVTYYVDGVQVASHPATFSAKLRPIMEDSPIDSYSLSANWAHMGPYPASSSFVSKVFDAGQSVTWGKMSWTADLPAGAGLTMSVRTGNSSTPDNTWSAYTTIPSSGSAINTSARYLQYKASFTSTNPAGYPVLRDVTIDPNFGSGGQVPPGPTPTPTSTPLPTATSTPLPTATNTPTATPTNTPLPTATNTPTATPTNTPLPTATNTPLPTATNTPTSTPTNTPLPTATNTPLPTATNTPLPTATSTPLPTATNTPLPTATNTPLPTATNTPLPTATNTPLPTATNTPLPTATNTPLPTATNTPLPTATNTPLPTATNTPLPTATNTPLPTATNTPLPTATNTPLPTATNTPLPTATNTPLPTATNTPLPTATNTPLPTATNTPLPTATNTPLPTATNTPLPTATNTPLPTATNTPLPTATNTPLPTATNTPLPTATNTPLPTATNTPLPTATNTPLPTATNTPLPTATNTPLPTATNTPLPTATNTPLPTATNTPLPTATNTPLPTATNTPLPTATNTPLPTATNTPLPTATNTPLPTATNTPLPTATNTPLPTATNTPLPTATNTPLPTATNTPLPTATSTPQPTATNTPLPTATSTPLPTATNTPLPTATSTPLPTATNTPLPTATSTPVPTATFTPLPTATNTPIPTPTSTPLPDLIFADGFETGNLSAWPLSVTNNGSLTVSTTAAMVGTYGLSANITNSNPSYVVNESPTAETSYHARFYFNPNSVNIGNGKSHLIFQALSLNGTEIVRLELGYNNGNGYRLRAAAINNGTYTSSSWVNVTNARHYIEFAWQAGTATTSGSLTLWVDGVSSATLTGLNSNTWTIDQVRLGAVAGMNGNVSGTEYFDAFESRRYTYIGQ